MFPDPKLENYVHCIQNSCSNRYPRLLKKNMLATDDLCGLFLRELWITQISSLSEGVFHSLTNLQVLLVPFCFVVV